MCHGLRINKQAILDNLIVLKACEDGSCVCPTQRNTIAGIAIIGLISSIVDLVMLGPCMNEHLETFRLILITQFQLASLLLLLTSIIEVAFLVQLYLWYTLGFVVLGLMVSLADFLARIREEGTVCAWAVFVPEVVFFFVLSRCLPLIDTYRKHLEGTNYPPSKGPILVYSL